MTDIINTKEIKNVVSKVFTYQPSPKFGSGDPEQEAKNCEKIRLFMSCVGKTSVELKRGLVSRETTLKETKEKFGRAMSQDAIYDENNYQFTEDDLNLPLHHFSNKCNLNVTFAHRSLLNNIFEDSKNIVSNLRSSSSSSSAPNSKL